MIILPEIEQYISAYSEKEPVLLNQLNNKTIEISNAHHMLSGEYQGRLLALISKMIQPTVIVEIGTFTGYSALCLAEGLLPSGILYTIDKDEKMQTIAKKYFDESSFANQIITILGEAKEKLQSITQKIDLAFIDADKRAYALYFDEILPKMNSNGIILFDNILWKGKVLEEEKDKITLAIHQFNQKIANDSRVESVLLPIRDGLTIMRVK